jgi:FkbM family methyltransferase
VEAMPSNYRSLCKNIELNNLQTYIKAINIGLGAKEGKALIKIEGNNPDRTGTANILPGNFEFGKIPLQIYSMDELITNGDLPRNISLIKIDTDGYDFEILKGARNLLTHQRPIVYAELSNPCMSWHGYSITQVVEYLSVLGYEVWTKRQQNPIKFAKYAVATEYTQDCLLIPLEKVDSFSKFLI